MMLEPNDKVNHIAMLNTLFPPVTNSTVAPTRGLPPQILQAQRDGFFRYINALETKGTGILTSVMMQGAPAGHPNSWPLVYDSLDKYLTLVNEVIDECAVVDDPAHLGEPSSPRHPKRGKIDSGISIGSNNSEVSLAKDDADKTPSQFPIPQKTNGSALERLAAEIRRLGPKAKSKNLRKMKSTTTLGVRPGSQNSYTDGSFFELDDQKRRIIDEATNRKNSQVENPSFLAH